MAKKTNDSVGYGRPPVERQFKAGQSGNPKGRPKGSRNFAAEVIRMLEKTVPVERNGKWRQISTQEALLLLVRERAFKGDIRALDRVIALAMQHNAGRAAEDESVPLTQEDQAILDDYYEARLQGDSGPLTPPPETSNARDKPGGDK